MSAGAPLDVAAHIPMVGRIARAMARRLPRHAIVDDLISAGYVGLLDAAKRFDPSRSRPFGTFAEFRIRGAMVDELRQRDSLTRDMRRVSNEIRQAAMDLERQLGHAPTDDQIARQLGIGVDELRARRQKLTGSIVVGFDDAGADLINRIRDHQSANPFDQVARAELVGQLVACIEALPPQMQQVLSLYYFRHLNLREIGAVLGVTESRVCQVHGEATRRLRDNCPHLRGHWDEMEAA